MDRRVGVVYVCREELEERFGKHRGGVVVRFDEGVSLVQSANLVVVAMRFWDFVRVGLRTAFY